MAPRPAKGKVDKALPEPSVNPCEIVVIEFDDKGDLFNEAQLDVALETSARHNKSEHGALVITFIHGWKHNATPLDKNLQSFEEVLSQLSHEEVNEQYPKPVVGVRHGPCYLAGASSAAVSAFA